MTGNSTNNVLASLARLLDENRDKIIAANKVDVGACPPDDAVILDRLKVNDAKITSMIASVNSVIGSPDPVGKTISSQVLSNGLRIENRQVPFGTILIIYEARPDVSIEAAIIAVKAGNRILLKGGREARNSNLFLAGLWREALVENDADPETVRYLDISREETRDLICGQSENFDLVIPRGGEGLIDFVLKNSRSPVVVSGRGNNFLYIDSEADVDMAINIALNGKQRLSVCNALDKILINTALPNIETVTARLIDGLGTMNIEVYGDASIRDLAPTVLPLENENIWFEEFLAAKIVIGVVESTNGAVEKINKYSGGHSASIITENAEAAQQFMNDVDCAAVYHNASVRFTDGGQFGLGAEIAISTQKLHFRGPLGSDHLVTNKWFVFGDGQIRK